MYANSRIRAARAVPLLITLAAFVLAGCNGSTVVVATPTPGLPTAGLLPTGAATAAPAIDPTRIAPTIPPAPPTATASPVPTPAPAAITIDTPPPGTLVGSPVVVTGRTDRVPTGGQLSYQLFDANGQPIGAGAFPINSAGQSGTFNASLAFTPPESGGDVRVALFDSAAPNRATSLTLFVAPPQSITISSPPPGTFIGSPVVISGQLARLPFQSNLGYRFVTAQGQQLGEGVVPVNGAPGRPTSFNASLRFALPPAGGDIRFEVYDQNAADGAVAASAALPLRVAPQPQQITFSSPAPGTAVGSPVVITGRTVRYPAQGTLGYRLTDNRGIELARGAFPVSGAPGQGAQFTASLNFSLPPQGGPVRIEVLDQNAATGVIIASAALQVQTVPQQQTITIETPALGTLVGSPVVITGRTARYPRTGKLSYRVRDANGTVLGTGDFPLTGAVDQPSTFTASIFFEPRFSQSSQIFVDIFEPDAAGGSGASATIQLGIVTPR